MKQIEIEKHIRIRSEALAEKKAKKMFEEWKQVFLSKRKQGVTYTLEQILSAKESSKLRQTYEVIANNPNIDRHSIHDMVNSMNDKEIGQSTVSGRIGDLIRSGLIEETGQITGKFGKVIATYSIA